MGNESSYVSWHVFNTLSTEAQYTLHKLESPTLSGLPLPCRREAALLFLDFCTQSGKNSRMTARPDYSRTQVWQNHDPCLQCSLHIIQLKRYSVPTKSDHNSDNRTHALGAVL